MYMEFPAKHRLFYEKFDKWRKETKNKNKPVSGVYELIVQKPIHRLVGIDEIGILYIGKGVILECHNRIGKFINSINSTGKIHLGGVGYDIDFIKEKYPLSNSIIRITLSEKPEELESLKLKKYLAEFGELPPFNRILS